MTAFPAATLKQFKGVALLKKIEKTTEKIFVDEEISKVPKDRQEQVKRATLESNFKGIADFSEEFFETMRLSAKRHGLTREFMRKALSELDDTGFCAFDRTLLKRSATIGDLYEPYYEAWCKAVQGNEVAAKLEKIDKASVKHLCSNYTIIQLNEKGEFYELPYYTVFKQYLDPIVEEMDALIKDMKSCDIPAGAERYVDFFECYRNALVETKVSNLEQIWADLDRIWCEIHYYIQVVHDIESGYGDPLRVKVIPDYSIRLIDESFADANATMKKIQAEMVKYFKMRDSELARGGLHALEASFVAIYYIPFVCGISKHFRFCGQSIPNRVEVKDEKGVKIYFDAVAAENRAVETRTLAHRVFADAESLGETVDAVDALVFHVAAHEVGHAIYPLESCRAVLKPDTVSLLEEPRAELTSLHTMLLLLEFGILDKKAVAKHLASFMLHDLRRFAKFNSSTTRPYTISALFTYRVYEEQKYIRLRDDGKIEVDHDKAVDVLRRLSQAFENLLGAQDRMAGSDIEAVLTDMERETDLHRHLVDKLKETSD